MGTWVYQHNDTVFKIRIVTKCAVELKSYFTWIQLFGNYYLKRGNKVIVDDLNKPCPTSWSGFDTPSQVTIKAMKLHEVLPDYNTTFYDLEKKHHNGKGTTGGYITPLAPNKIRWVLDEVDGSFETEFPIIGFSVPTDVIMTKEE